jgi:hypothetical protein
LELRESERFEQGPPRESCRHLCRHHLVRVPDRPSDPRSP